MVYYNTSRNIKMLRSIIIDYRASQEASPYEYMKMYVEKLPETMEDTKISWIVETFLGIQKHSEFLKNITYHVSQELSEDDQDYFMIIFYVVTFQLSASNMTLLYKCLFNLSRPLLKIFTNFLSNNEALTVISQIAHNEYDTNFVTEKIINPLFTWQPYISEMGHNYAEFMNKTERSKMKMSTIPIQPNVLNRKSTSPNAKFSPDLPPTPANSVQNKSKNMLTKSTIDKRLKQIHDSNKQKALHLLQDIKSNNQHYTQGKSDKYFKTLKNFKEDIDHKKKKVTLQSKSLLINQTPPLVKETAATIKRINNTIQMSEKKEIQWLEDILYNCKNTTKAEELEYYDRQERERERLLDIERKHLVGQISYEEAVIAKKKLIDDNKKKHDDFLREKQIWEEEIERWRRSEMEKNRMKVEKLSLIELEMLHARNNIIIKKKETAEKIRKESEERLAQALKMQREELDRKIQIIKEINILAHITKKSKLPKIIDLTETSGVGLLCEMSIAELQERLTIFKMGLKEELEKKKQDIKLQNRVAKQELDETKKNIDKYMTEQADMRKQKKKPPVCVGHSSCNEIKELKKVLEEKRKLRIQLTS